MSTPVKPFVGDLRYSFATSKNKDGQAVCTFTFQGPAGGIGLILLPDQAQNMVTEMQACIDHARRLASTH